MSNMVGIFKYNPCKISRLRPSVIFNSVKVSNVEHFENDVTIIFFFLYHFLFYCISISYSSLPLDTNRFVCSYKVVLLAQLTYVVRKWVCQIQAVHLSTKYMFAAARHKGKEKVDHLPTSSWRLSPRATI